MPKAPEDGRRAFAAVLAGVSLLLWPSRAATAPPEGAYTGYNVILLSLGNVGAQHMSLYGYERRTTPRLDKIAKNALVFEQALSPASWTLPVAASIFTALHPYSHKILHRHHQNVLDPDIRTLPEVLRDDGYRTASFTGGVDYYKGFSTMRGFQETDSNPNFTGLGTSLRQARDWLSRNDKKKFFLFIHGYEAHCPFTPDDSVRGTFSDPRKKGVTVDDTRCVRGTWKPRWGRFETYYSSRCPQVNHAEPCANKSQERVYLTPTDLNHLQNLHDEAILSLDAKVAAFLSSLDKSVQDRTIVVVLAEHGEMFAKHGRFGRAAAIRGTLYDDVVHVPLMILIPGVPGRRVPGLVELGDLAPTLARLLGVRLPHRIQGKDLSPLIWGGTSVHDFVFAGLPFMRQPPPFQLMSINESIRDREWKLLREVTYPQEDWSSALRRLLGLPPKKPREDLELYHLANDPDESLDLTATHPEMVRRLSKELETRVANAKAFNPHTPKTRPMPKRLQEDARRHGYW